MKECQACRQECWNECRETCSRIDYKCQNTCRECFPEKPKTISEPPVTTPELPEKSELLYEADFSNQENGVLSMPRKETRHPRYYSIPSLLVSDFILEVDARKSSGPNVYCKYGIWFRYKDPDNFYYFFVSTDGHYGLYKQASVKPTRKWDKVINWTRSSHINQGGNWNHLKVVAIGSKITLFVNNEKLTSVIDESVQEGHIALVSTFHNPNIEIHFDNLKIWSIAD